MRILLLPVLTGFWLSGAAQQSQQSLLSSGGGHAVTNSYIIDWALGESVVETATSSIGLYTQGFLQPLVMKRSLEIASPFSGIKITAFPNPIQGRVTLLFSSTTTEPTYLTLYNTVGIVVLRTTIPQGNKQFSVNTTGLAQGSYFLSLANNKRTVSESFNLIKLN